MRKILFTLTFLLAFVASTMAQDTVRVSAHYLDSRVPLTKRAVDEQTVQGYSASADIKLFNLGKLRGSAAYEFEQRYNVEVYPMYFDGMNIVDLYRNVRTHYVGAQAGYTIGYAVEPFLGYFVGTNKIHENADRQIVSKVRVGVNVPFAKESHFFVKAAVDFNRSYGSPTKDMGPIIVLPPVGDRFISPDTRQVVLGAGFRF
jgi:hypothetical protein